MMTLLLSILVALIGLLAICYHGSRADSTFENAFQEHIAPISDSYFCTKIPSHSAAIQECTLMDILWLKYEANGGIAVRTSLGGPHLGYLNQLTANEIHHDAGEDCCWVPIFSGDEIWRGDRMVRLIEPLSGVILEAKLRRP